MTTTSVLPRYAFVVRWLHDSPKLSCELYVGPEESKEFWGNDDSWFYVNTYWNQAEAEDYGRRIVEQAARDVTVDVGHGFCLQF